MVSTILLGSRRGAPLGAPIADVFSAPSPALVRSVTLERADRSFSQLLAGDSYWPRRELRHRPPAHVAFMNPQAPHVVPPHERLMMRPEVDEVRAV